MIITGEESFAQNFQPSESVRPKCSGSSASSSARLFTSTMDSLRECGWYWGSISPQEAQKLLADKEAGSFLLRDSSDERYIFTLSVKVTEEIVHVRINQHKGKFSFGSSVGSESTSSGTVVELIDKAVKNCSDNRFRYLLHPKAGEHAAETIRLVRPISRFCFVPSMKHLCRFEILRHVRADHVDRLPLPNKLKVYLKDPKHIAEMPV